MRKIKHHVLLVVILCSIALFPARSVAWLAPGPFAVDQYDVEDDEHTLEIVEGIGISGQIVFVGSWVTDYRGEEREDYARPTSNKAVIYYPQNLGAGPFPLIVYGHGMRARWHTCPPPEVPLDDPRRDNTIDYKRMSVILRHLASWGFIVVSVDLSWLTPDGTITGINNRKFALRDAVNYMVGENSRDGSLFRNRINTNRIGLMGHSMGADAAVSLGADAAVSPVAIGLLEGTVRAIAAIAPPNHDHPRVPPQLPDNYQIENFAPKPVIIFQGTRDSWYRDPRPFVPVTDPTQTLAGMLYEAARPQKHLVTITDANHFGYTDDLCVTADGEANQYSGMNGVLAREDQQDIAKAYLAAFFRRNLRGETGWDDYLNDRARFADLAGFDIGVLAATAGALPPPNGAPVCNAGGPYFAAYYGDRATVMLNGSGSSDPDGDTLHYEWSNPFLPSPAEGAAPVVDFPLSGPPPYEFPVYEFPVVLSVSDGLAAEASRCPPATVRVVTPDSFDRETNNDSFETATPLDMMLTHPLDLRIMVDGEPTSVVDTYAAWSATARAQNLHNRTDRDFFKIQLPDLPSYGDIDPILAGIQPLIESGTMERRNWLSFVRLDPGGERLTDLLLFSGGLDIRGVDKVYYGGMSTETLEFDDPQSSLLNMAPPNWIHLSYGENEHGVVPNYNVNAEYWIKILRVPKPTKALLALAQDHQIAGTLSCPGGIFPKCKGLNFKNEFEAAHPHFKPLRDCRADGPGCPDYFVFSWEGTSAFDVKFTAMPALKFKLLDLNLKQIAEAVQLPQIPIDGQQTLKATSLASEQPVIQQLYVSDLAPGFYVLEVSGPEASYTVSFVPPPPAPDSDGDGIVDPFDPCPGKAEDIDGILDADGCPDPTVTIDIKPGSDKNCFNQNGHGVIPVTIFGNAEINVRDIDPATLLLQGLSVKMAGKSGKYLTHYQYVNNDNYLDLVVQFEDSDRWINSGNGTAKLTGFLKDGTGFGGTDTICIVPKQKIKIH